MNTNMTCSYYRILSGFQMPSKSEEILDQSFCIELAKEHIRDLFGQGVGNVLTLAGCVSIQNLIEQRAKHLTRLGLNMDIMD